MLSPCKDCSDRKQGCHAKCEKYKTFRKIHDEELVKQCERRRIDWLIDHGKGGRKR